MSKNGNELSAKVNAFCGLLLALDQKYRLWRESPGSHAKQRKLNAAVLASSQFKVIERQRLQNLLEAFRRGGPLEFGSGQGFLFLEPPRRLLLPVLSLSLEEDRMSAGVALFTFKSPEEEGMAFEESVAAVGFRFETPESKGAEHKYHHVQMIRKFNQDSGPDLPGVPLWFPLSHPAFLISARSPFSLFLGAIISIYGLGYLEREFKGLNLTPLGEDMKALRYGCGAY